MITSPSSFQSSTNPTQIFTDITRSCDKSSTCIGGGYHQPKKSVSFGFIEIREYELMLGHHISCMEGPPIALGKKCINQDQMNIDEYEATRRRYRSTSAIRLGATHRRELLHNVYGYSEREILEKEIEIEKERQLRKVKLKHDKKSVMRKSVFDTRINKIRVNKRRRRLSIVRRHSVTSRKRRCLNKEKSVTATS